MTNQGETRTWHVLARQDGGFTSLFVEGILGGTQVKRSSQIDAMVRDFISLSEDIPHEEIKYNLVWGEPFSQDELAALDLEIKEKLASI
jgi:hypothetical protein